MSSPSRNAEGWVNRKASDPFPSDDEPDLDMNVTSLPHSSRDTIQYDVHMRNNSSVDVDDSARAKAKEKWRHATKGITESDQTPDTFPDLNENSSTPAVRLSFDVDEDTFRSSDEVVRVSRTPFARGAYRECFHLKKLSRWLSNPTWDNATCCVAKRYIPDVVRAVWASATPQKPTSNPKISASDMGPRQELSLTDIRHLSNEWTLRDVKIQMTAKRFADAYNATGVPKGVDFLQAFGLEFDLEGKGHPEMFCVEHFLEGDYEKFNNNAGWVSAEKRNSPHAFSHFTYQYSQGQYCVTDIQGVDDIYTDPQIHSAVGRGVSGFGDGDLGAQGIALFFYSHRCNPLCEYLNLTPFPLFGESTGADQDPSVWDGTTTRELRDKMETSRKDAVVLRYHPPPKVTEYSIDEVNGLVHLELARFHDQDLLPFKSKISHTLPNAAQFAKEYHLRLARESGLDEETITKAMSSPIPKT